MAPSNTKVYFLFLSNSGVSNCSRYQPVPTKGSPPVRPAWSMASCCPSCTIAIFCLSLFMLNGPYMAQSCGIRTDCHCVSSNAGSLNCGLSSRVNFHPFSNKVSVRTCVCADSHNGRSDSTSSLSFRFIDVVLEVM